MSLDRLTMAAVAQRLGVRLPSLYKHVDGAHDLHCALAVLALGELERELTRATVGKSREDALRALACAYRDYAGRRPGRYAATLRAADSADQAHADAADAVLTVVTAALAGYGLRGDDVVDAIRILRSALHGFVTLEALGGFGLPRSTDRTFDRLVAGLSAAFAQQAGG
jgi:AcrR family transcriptional regulator